MKLSRSTLQTRAFVLNWQSLEQLHGFVEARLPKVSISAKCSDQLDREFASLQELKDFANPSRSAIQQLTISARDPEFNQRFSISLSNNHRRNVQIILEANEENATALNEFSTDIIESLRPWYSWVAKADWYWLVLGGLFASQIALFAIRLVLAGEAIVTFSSNVQMTAKETIKWILIGAAPVAVGLLLNLLRDKFFPMGAFAIGQGELRHTSAEVTRTVLIAGLAVSIITSAAFSLFL